MNTPYQNLNKTALLVIDVQKGFDASSWGKRNNLDAEKNIQRLLEFWRSQNRLVIHSVNLASLNGEFCQVIRVEKLLN